MSFVAVLPYIVASYRDGWVESAAEEFRRHTLMVDNTGINLGIMRSHNLGFDHVMRTGADWLIVCSAAVRFGAPGGMDFVEALDDHDSVVVEASGVYGWHLIAFSRECLIRVGKWDENFTPYGFDDIDMSLRIQRAFSFDPERQLWPKVVVDVKDTGMAHSVHVGGVTADVDKQIEYFTKKWGRHPGGQEKAYDRPFGVPWSAVGYWPSVDGGRWDA